MAQHNGSHATARAVLKMLGRAAVRDAGPDLATANNMLDVGGGSGAFSYAFIAAAPQLECTVLELPEVCKVGRGIRAEQPVEIRNRVRFRELDVANPSWPVRGKTGNEGAAAVVGAVAFVGAAAAVDRVDNRPGKHGIGASLSGSIVCSAYTVYDPVMNIKMLCALPWQIRLFFSHFHRFEISPSC